MPKIEVNSGVQPDDVFIPPSETAYDSDVAILLEEQDAALQACLANFPSAQH